MPKNSFHCQWIALSIITSILLPNVDGAALRGFFLRPVRYLQMLECPLNATGWLAQAATLLEITTQLVDDIDYGFICDSLSAIGPPCGPFNLENC